MFCARGVGPIARMSFRKSTTPPRKEPSKFKLAAKGELGRRPEGSSTRSFEIWATASIFDSPEVLEEADPETSSATDLSLFGLRRAATNGPIALSVRFTDLKEIRAVFCSRL